jgi:hypothetical protein
MTIILELATKLVSTAVCILIITASAVAQTAPSASDPRTGAGKATGRYYVDFRVGLIGTYGHSYVAYGRLNAQGKPADAHYADLHPMGNYLVMAVGHVLPVPANTDWDPGVLELPVTSSYFRVINAADYARLQAALRKARAEKQPYWNALTNNCNHFIAKLARAIGLRTPTDLLISYAFIPALRDLNEGSAPPSRRATPSAHSAPPRS